MFSMERDPRKENGNLVENSKDQQILEAVEASETHPSPVERARKFHYLQTFAEGVVKADIKRKNLVKLWKQYVGIVP